MTIVRSWWFRLTLGAAILLLLVAGTGMYLMSLALTMPPPPGFAKPGNSTEANRQDLAYLKRTLDKMDRSFSSEGRRSFDRTIDDLSNRAASLEGAKLEMEVARAVALANNGHTNLVGAGWGLTLNSIPLRFYWFADGLHVVKSDSANSDLLGAKVIGVAGRTPGDLVDLLHSYVGGRESLAREFAVHFMESPQALNAIDLTASPSTMQLRLETVDGSVIERNVAAVPFPASGTAPPKTPMTLRFDPRELYWPRRELSPIPLPDKAPYPQPTNDGRQWVHVLDGKEVPLSLQHPNSFYWSTYVDAGQILFVQINVTMDQPDQQPLAEFLQNTLKGAAARKPRFAIVDLRSNPGGSYQRTAEFAQALPGLIPNNGKVFILTSGNTFSAGLVTTARLKYFSGNRGAIVGETIGDFPHFWAEAATRILLPNSGLRVGYATGYHDWGNSCSLKQVFICYLPNYFGGVAAGNLDPTVPVSWAFADYVSGKDTVLERVMQIVGAAR